MLQIINKIPLYVWPLFAVLLLGGLKAKKTSTVPLAALLFPPFIFFGWFLFSFFGDYGTDPLAILFWLLSLALGCRIGFLHMQRVDLQFDRQNKKVEIAGSWIPLILSMSIFGTKFASQMMRATMPYLHGSFLFLGLELFSTIIFGIVAGRSINCLIRYRTASANLLK
jgi:hypothetical protein